MLLLNSSPAFMWNHSLFAFFGVSVQHGLCKGWVLAVRPQGACVYSALKASGTCSCLWQEKMMLPSVHPPPPPFSGVSSFLHTTKISQMSLSRLNSTFLVCLALTKVSMGQLSVVPYGGD